MCNETGNQATNWSDHTFCFQDLKNLLLYSFAKIDFKNESYFFYLSSSNKKYKSHLQIFMYSPPLYDWTYNNQIGLYVPVNALRNEHNCSKKNLKRYLYSKGKMRLTYTKSQYHQTVFHLASCVHSNHGMWPFTFTVTLKYSVSSTRNCVFLLAKSWTRFKWEMKPG